MKQFLDDNFFIIFGALCAGIFLFFVGTCGGEVVARRIACQQIIYEKCVIAGHNECVSEAARVCQ